MKAGKADFHHLANCSEVYQPHAVCLESKVSRAVGVNLDGAAPRICKDCRPSMAGSFGKEEGENTRDGGWLDALALFADSSDEVPNLRPCRGAVPRDGNE
jgi:hypothetical protein